MNIQFRSWICKPRLMYYNNDRRALSFVDHITSEPILTASVNVVAAEKCADDEIFIKDYSENDGIFEVLVGAEYIHPEVIQSVHSGHVIINSYKLTDKALALWETRFGKEDE